MHPVVALALLITAIGFLARGGWPEVVLVGAACLAAMPAVPALDLRRLASTVRRLRFLYLSILILYAWFTPGAEPLWPALGMASPSASGLAVGLRHIAILVVIVAAVQIFLAGVGRDHQVASLRWWLWPLRRLGMKPDRVALRLMLVAEALPRLRALAAGVREEASSASRLQRLTDRASRLLAATLAEAERVDLPRVDLPCLDNPRPRQWIPLVAAVAVLAAV